MSKLYRIYTEAKNTEEILDETKACFKSFSAIVCSGVYDRQEELGLILEFVTEYNDFPLVKTLAQSIKHMNKQQAVLVTEQDVTVTII